MLNKNEPNDNKSIQKQNNKRKASQLRLMMIIIAVYLVLTLIVISIFAPRIIGYIGNILEYVDLEFAIIVFILTLTIATMMIIMLIISYYRYKEIKQEEIKVGEVSANLYGTYSEERRYLEKRIDELTLRLTNTEKKWKDMNHLILAANEKSIGSNGHISQDGFLAGFGIDLQSIEIDKKMVFVLTPSDIEYAEDYYVIQKVCRDCNLRALRGDEEDLHYGDNNILTYILQHILKSRIVIANVSNRNPNVFYELGIAHMAGKPTILISREGSNIPFDLQQKFIVFYSSQEELSHKLKDAIIKIYTKNDF